VLVALAPRDVPGSAARRVGRSDRVRRAPPTDGDRNRLREGDGLDGRAYRDRRTPRTVDRRSGCAIIGTRWTPWL